MSHELLTTDHKALAVNIDQRRYGTFAEIGAGQEVVRWFFHVGGAAGTIAKSISAYDMAVSDAIYGESERYVSRQRLQAMLDYEHALNLSRLQESRGDTTAFFTFADTVSARNYQGTNECHGWMGVRFQAYPRDQDSQIILHVQMLDVENALQQEALGIVGVNLLYGAFFLNHDPDKLIESLLDNLTTRRIEIDMIEFSGIAFREVDNRVMSLRLVQLGLSDAAMFSAKGEVLQPSEVLHKRPILVERGSFRPVTHVNVDMLRAAQEKFSREPDVAGEPAVTLMEITMRNLQTAGGQANGQGGGEIDLRDFLARADVLAACGTTVLISNYFEYYRLAAYLARYTKKKIGITMGASSLLDLFDEKYYTALDGRHPRIVRPALQERSEAVRLPAPGSEDGRGDHGPEPARGPRAPQAVRLPGREGLYRAVGQLQPGLSADFLPRRDPADPSGRQLVERPRAPRGRRGHPPPRFLRLSAGEPRQRQPGLKYADFTPRGKFHSTPAACTNSCDPLLYYRGTRGECLPGVPIMS